MTWQYYGAIITSWNCQWFQVGIFISNTGRLWVSKIFFPTCQNVNLIIRVAQFHFLANYTLSAMFQRKNPLCAEFSLKMFSQKSSLDKSGTNFSKNTYKWLSLSDLDLNHNLMSSTLNLTLTCNTVVKIIHKNSQ